MRPDASVILSIAGSDPSGGAGIQADLKTMTVLGVYGAAAVTCLTIQNTLGVAAVTPLSPETVRRQVEAVLADMPVSHVKTGMMGDGAIAAAVGEILADFPGEIVCDPVLRASSGPHLLAPADLRLAMDSLFARATVLTPNIPELEGLAGHGCHDTDRLTEAAAQLFRRWPKLRALAVKGGHFREEEATVTDLLFLRTPSGGFELAARRDHARIQSPNTHGTGCTFASAFAACHLLTGSYEAAFRQAGDLVSDLIRKSASARLGAGCGPLLHHLHH